MELEEDDFSEKTDKTLWKWFRNENFSAVFFHGVFFGFIMSLVWLLMILITVFTFFVSWVLGIIVLFIMLFSNSLLMKWKRYYIWCFEKALRFTILLEKKYEEREEEELMAKR